MASLRNPVQWLLDALGNTKGIPRVTEKTALMSASFWYGVNRISGNVGTLPFNVHRELPNGGSEKAKDHPTWRLLRTTPNAYQSPMVFKQAETKRALMWGNSRSVIVGTGRSRELLPQHPGKSFTAMVNGEKWHCFMPDADDRIVLLDDLMEEMMRNPNKTIMKADKDVLHIQGFGDGVVGLSLIEFARTSIQITLSGDQNSLKQMTKGFAGKAMLEAPADSAMWNDSKKAKEFYDDFVKAHGNDGSGDQIGMLRNGIKLNTLQMSNKDAEFIEQLKYRRQEAALWLLLESILGDDSATSYNSLEQKNTAYLQNCLMNWLIRWEQECNKKLLTQSEYESESVFCKFNTESMKRPDAASTAEILTKYLQNRVFSPNEVRRKLDEQPIDGQGMDSYVNPMITPGDGETDPETPSASRSVIVSQLEHMLKIEEKQVNKFLAQNHSFKQIDEWYENKWINTLAQKVEELGGEWVIAQNHCRQSLAYLKRKPETFDLSGSAESLADEILKKE